MKPGNLFIGREIHKSMRRLARRRCCHWETREKVLLSCRLFVFRCLFNTNCNFFLRLFLANSNTCCAFQTHTILARELIRFSSKYVYSVSFQILPFPIHSNL